jgi:hypothetical protein
MDEQEGRGAEGFLDDAEDRFDGMLPEFVAGGHVGVTHCPYRCSITPPFFPNGRSPLY